MLHYIDLSGYPFDEFNEVDIVRSHIVSGEMKTRINKAQKAKLLSKKKIHLLKRYLSGLEQLCLHPDSSGISTQDVKKAVKYSKKIKSIIKERREKQKHQSIQ